MSDKHAFAVFRSLADGLCTTAIARELKARDANCHVTAITSSLIAPALLNNSFIDELIILDDPIEILRSVLPELEKMDAWTTFSAPFDDPQSPGFYPTDENSMAEKLSVIRSVYNFNSTVMLLPSVEPTPEEAAQDKAFVDSLPAAPIILLELDSDQERSWAKDRVFSVLEALRELEPSIVLACEAFPEALILELKKRLSNVYWANSSPRMQLELYKRATFFLGYGGTLSSFTKFLPTQERPLRFELPRIANYPNVSSADIEPHRTVLQTVLHRAKKILIAPKKLSEPEAEEELREEVPETQPTPLSAQVIEDDNRSMQGLLALARSGVAINQMVTSISPGDAITNCMLLFRDMLRSWGFQSYIFCESGHHSLEGEWHWIGEHQKMSASKNLLIYHPNSGTSVLNEYFAQVPDKKLIYYHNITPAKFFSQWNPEVAGICESARKVLPRFVHQVCGAICDSHFNAADLMDLGYKQPTVIPIPFSAEARFSEGADRKTLWRLNTGETNLLFVGRLAPNKCQHDLIRLFAIYQSDFNPNSRLILAGANRDGDSYNDSLRELVGKLGVENVEFTGSITESELAAYYQGASVFVCMSEHEGFCVPLIEAMHFGVPIVAFDSSAVTETIGDAGIMLSTKDPLPFCHAVESIRTNRELKSQLVRRGKERLQYFKKEEYGRRMANYLLSLYGQDTTISRSFSAATLGNNS